jgi:glycosyltransferase involved in cell wall biosynthesis
VIIGDGPQKNELLEFAKKLQVEGKIVWLGRRDRIRTHIRLFDVFVLTSLYEGFGLVLLEAIQSKVPIAASNNSAIPEVLGPDFQGLCVTGSAPDFVSKIESLKSNAYKIGVLNAQSNRLEIFNSSVMSQSVDRVYLLK